MYYGVFGKGDCAAGEAVSGLGYSGTGIYVVGVILPPGRFSFHTAHSLRKKFVGVFPEWYYNK